jgi:aspartyl protease family protein
MIDLGRLCGSNSSSPSTRPTITPGSATNSQGIYRTVIKRREGRLPVIDVTFNGRYKFEMIVDTGASGTLITAEMARAMQLRPVGRIYVNTASEQGVPMLLALVNSMEVNGAVARNVRVAVANQGLDIGLLGHDFFGNYDLTIKRDVVEFRLR